ncbi:MAG: beta-lactamase family protein [Gemmatimonadetes bacterium]|nr:beta-lactamase family protein [Gemmatimonadota bacterium]
MILDSPRPRACARLALAATIVLAAPAAAQTFAPNPQVDRIFAEWDRPTSPGCVLGVLRDGRFIYQRGFGMANLDYDIPNSPKLVYYVGSVSKQFTAATVALLSLQGKLSLDDDVRKYIPELADYGTPITIRHLIHHTSGLRDIYTLMELAGRRLEDVMTDEEALALIARQKELNFKPGTDYLYSNSGYWLLGQIVERVTGKSLREVADELLFQPLGMTHTHFHDDPGHVMKWRAMSYEKDDHGGFRISYLQNFDKIGAGGLYTTMDDLRKWDDNFYSHKVGGEALQRLMHTRGVLENGDTLMYAFANNITTYRGLRVTEHGGSMMGYKAELMRFPDEHFTVALQCNLGAIDPGALARKVAEVYLGPKMGPAPPAARRERPTRESAVAAAPVGAAELAAFAGDYYSPELDATYRVAVDGGQLTLKRPITAATPLEPAGPDTFRAGALTLHFVRAGGAASAFTVEHVGMRP